MCLIKHRQEEVTEGETVCVSWGWPGRQLHFCLPLPLPGGADFEWGKLAHWLLAPSGHSVLTSTCYSETGDTPDTHGILYFAPEKCCSKWGSLLWWCHSHSPPRDGIIVHAGCYNKIAHAKKYKERKFTSHGSRGCKDQDQEPASWCTMVLAHQGTESSHSRISTLTKPGGGGACL